MSSKRTSSVAVARSTAASLSTNAAPVSISAGRSRKPRPTPANGVTVSDGAVAGVVGSVAGPLPALPLFGPAPLLAHEDRAAYEELAARIAATVGPLDVIEQLWVRDIVDLQWEVQRLRRLKTRLLQAGIDDHIAQLSANRPTPAEARKGAKVWEESVVETWRETQPIDDAFKTPGDDAAVTAIRRHLDILERLDRVAASAEARRDKALRSLEQRRQALAARVRSVIDAEVADIPAPDTRPATS